jgi:hypothetical protein
MKTCYIIEKGLDEHDCCLEIEYVYKNLKKAILTAKAMQMEEKVRHIYNHPNGTIRWEILEPEERKPFRAVCYICFDVKEDPTEYRDVVIYITEHDVV